MKKINTAIKILIAEHDTHDLAMIDNELKKGGIDFVSEIVKNEAGYREALHKFIPDIILCDYSFPSFDGLTAFKIREQLAPETPFILVSGTIGEEYSIELIKNGVTDFVLKDKIFSLSTKVIRALKDGNDRKDKNKAAQDLKKSQASLIKAQAIAKTGSWETDLSSLEVAWSEETYRIFGVDQNNFGASHAAFLQFIHPDDVDTVDLAFRTSFNKKLVNSIEHRIITPAGLMKYVEECWQIFFDEQDKPVKAVGTCQDITERKNNEAAINKAYVEKNMILESIDDGFFATDKNSVVTYWNRKAEILLDVKKEDVLGKNVHEMFAGSRSTIFYDNYQKAVRENSTARFEGFSERTGKWFAVSAFPSDNGLSVYFKDVTERKKDEEKIKESELRYRSIIEQATDAICIADANMKIIDINPYGCQMLGYSKTEFLQLTISDLFLPEDLKANPFKIDELRSGKVIRNERRFKRKDGTLIEVEMSGRILADGRFIVFGHDIAERKKAEQLISQSEKKFRAFFENSMDGILLSLPDGEILAANPAACEIFRMTEQEICTAGRNGLVDMSDPGAMLFINERQLTGKVRGELKLKRKDGSIFPGEISSVMFKDAFGRSKTSMIIRDVSDKKKLEKALEAEQQRFAGLYLQSPSCMGILKGPNHVYETANPLYRKLIGKTDIIGKTVKEVLPEMESQGIFELLDSVYKTGKTFSASEMLIQFDLHGTGKLVDTYLNFMYQAHRDNQNKIDGILFFAIDVTEQVLSRKKIEESENRFRQIVETAQEGIWLIDENNITTFVNNKMCEILEYTEAEMMGKDIYYFMDEEGKKIAKDLIEFKKNGHFGQDYFKYIAKSGKEIWTNLSANPLFDEKGTYKGSLAMVTDITEKKKAEKRYQFQATLLNTIGQAAIATDMQGKINFWNKAASAIYGWTEEEVLGKNIIEIAPAEQTKDQAEQIMQELLLGNSWSGEFTVKRKDGSEFPAFVTNAPIYDQQHQLIGIIGVSSDITDRKQAELQLKESNKRYNLISQATNDMVWDWDLVTGKVYRNKEGWKKIFRTGDKEIENESMDDWESRIHPEDKDKFKIVKEEIQRPAKGFFEIECRIRRDDGTYAFIHDRGNIFRNEQGKAVRLIGATQDITVRKEAEIQVAKSELRFRSLVQNSSDLTSIMDKKGYYVYSSPAVKRVLGYDPEFMLGKNAFSFIHPGDINTIKAHLEKKDTKTDQKVIAFRFKNEKGEWRWLESKVSDLSDPEAEGYIFNSRDITERKLAEEVLINTTEALKGVLAEQVVLRKITEESEARLKEAQAIAHLGHWELNLKTNIVRSSDEACMIYGLSAQEHIQSYSNWLSFIHPEDVEYVKTSINRSKETRTGSEINHRIILRNGTVKYIAAASRVKFDETGALLGLYGISHDITERKQADIRLNDLNQDLQKQAKALAVSNEELEQFAYVASHDLQEPLRMVTSFLTLLRKKYGVVIDDKGMQYIDFAVDGAKRMRQIILDLLEFSRVGKTEDKQEDIDLNELIEEIQILFRKQIQEKKAVIIPNQLPHIKGYRSPIRHVFQNLISNALKYTLKDRAAKITISCTGFADHWQFAVRDNGIGIDKEYFEKIFVIFQRLNAKDEFSGTGMGLAITKKIIENEEGKIWVESEAGKGSTFYFTLLKN